MKRLFYFWEELKATFWFIPVLIITAAILLSILSIYLDTYFNVSRKGIAGYIFVASADSARSILTSLSAAMIGVAGTVFSITLVVLTLASSQFGSRLVKNFMYDRINQIVLGTYISTFIYCLIVLNSIKSTPEIEFVPVISVLIALVIALANIILLIVFIHHIAVSIQAENVISDISDSMIRHIKVLFPEKLGDQMDDVKEHEEEDAKAAYEYELEISSDKSGYLQYIDNDGLIDLVKEYDGLAELHYRPGGYLVEGIAICTIYTNKKLEEEERGKLINETLGLFVLGGSRTHQQDAEHSIHQMVEIAVRALSPGVNDPYTAVACVDNLTAVMAYLSKANFPSKYRYDDEENLRVIVVKLDFEGVLNAAFNQIRQFSASSPAVVIRLMEALITIDKVAKKDSYKKAIRTHAKMIMDMAENQFAERNDLEDLKKRSEKILPEDY